MNTLAPPRSGVGRLTARDIRHRMLANSWGILPIAAHDDNGKGAGKRPVIKAWQSYADFEAAPAPLRAVESWDRRFPGAQGTGIPCGDVVGIDIDILDPALAVYVERLALDVFGETHFVRQGRAPKLLLAYPAGEPIAKRRFSGLDGSNDGIDILGVGSQFVAYGIHPGTWRPYEWIGGESPLTASPDAAPEISNAQVATFIERVSALLPLSVAGGGQGRKGGGASAEIVRNADGLVVDGREAHLTRQVWAACVDLDREGQALTDEAVASLAWERFAASTLLNVDGREWSRADVEQKVRGTLNRLNRKVIKLPPKPEIVAPTYADEARSVSEAEAEARAGIEEFFHRHVPTYRNALRAFDLTRGTSLLAIAPQATGWLFRIEAGIGKTEVAVSQAAIAAKAGLEVTFSVPRVDLGDEVAARFARHGVEARVWRGREQADPDSLGLKMCLNLPAVKDAIAAGEWSVREAVCETRDPRLKRNVRCEFFDVCGHVRQRNASPRVWIVPHAVIFRHKPAAIPRPDALVIDEGFIFGAIPNKPSTLTLDALEVVPLPLISESASLEDCRARLLRCLREASDGPVSRTALMAAGLTADIARSSRALENLRLVDSGIMPGMDPRERAKRAAEAGTVNRSVRLMSGLWAEIATFLDNEHEFSGRLTLARDKETGARQIERRSLKTVDASWHAPTLLIDATAPPADLISKVLGLDVELRSSIAAKWSSYRQVRQIVGAPVSSKKLGISGRGNGNAKVLGDLRRLILVRAALAFPRQIAIVAQKQAIDRLESLGLPNNVLTGHFGGLAGLDTMKHAAGMLVIGRTLPDLLSSELTAGVLAGEPVATEAIEQGATRWYPKTQEGIRQADGTVMPIEWLRHEHPTVEALRWQICEGQLIQAIGRLRPLRRAETEGFFLDIISDVPLPVPVDRVDSWERTRLGAWAEMASEGVILSSPADIMAAYPDIAPTRDRARAAVRPETLGETSIGESYIDVSPNVMRFTYKRRGPHKPASALILPNGPIRHNRLRRWLGERVGPIEDLKLDGEGDTLPTVFKKIGADVGQRVAMWASVGSG